MLPVKAAAALVRERGIQTEEAYAAARAAADEADLASRLPASPGVYYGEEGWAGVFLA